MKKLLSYIRLVFARNRFLAERLPNSKFRGKIAMLLIVAVSFLILSVINIYAKAYEMLHFTLCGFVVSAVFAVLSWKTQKPKLCSYPAIIMCAAIFSFFVITGGNDGFACLWIALMPAFSMAIMEFIAGLISSVILQAFLIVVFWTPVHTLLPYQYNEQFCLRFPLFFLVAFLLGLVMTISLQKSQYEAQQNLSELEKVSAIANRLAKYDPLTELANRRCAYEIFSTEFADETIPHSIVMGDIDKFKDLNDSYGHEFGDEVLVTISKYITKLLPESYLKSRWGGEEFLIAANEPIEVVYDKIEALRREVSAHEFRCGGETVRVTLTFGISEYYKAAELNDAINLADSRLYLGKNAARNCTVMR